MGFLIGSVMGGKFSDRAVKKWIIKRNGVRLPQDRLNSGLATLFAVLPASTLIYGWTLQEGVGGMPVPIISAFFAGVGLLGSFNGLNTYSAGRYEHLSFEDCILISLQRSCRISGPRSSAGNTSCSICSLQPQRQPLSH